MQSRLQIETKPGRPIKIGKNRIVPYSQSVRYNLPQINGGVIWNHPTSILAIDADGEEKVIPVPDITRRIEIAIYGGGLVVILLVWLISQIQNRTRR
jgi:hypothetical protein